MTNNETAPLIPNSGMNISDMLLAEYATALGLAARLLPDRTESERAECAILRTAYQHNGPTDLAESMLRAALKAMSEVAAAILVGGSSLAADPLCAKVKEVFATVGFDRITRKDRERIEARRLLSSVPDQVEAGSRIRG